MRIFNKKTILLCLSVCLLSGLFASENTVEMISDPLKLVIYPKTGNFCLYHSKAENAREYEPLYDDRSQSSVNIYSVLFNGEIFHLNNKSGKKIIISQSKDEITVTFQISMDFLATQTFSFVPSKQRSTGKLLKVVTEIQNISGAIANVGLKAVFDTSLGEKNLIPLYTDLRSEIGAELMLQPVLEKDSVIFSADRGYACLFFLRNEYMTTPSAVYIANWERLVTKRWLPSYISGRSFRKYGSADPGLLYVWSEQKVPNKETFTVTNCIGFYDYRNAAETLTPYSAYTQPASEASVQSVAAPVTKPTVTTIYRTAPASRPAAVEKKQSGEVAEPAASVEPVPEVQPDGRSTPAQPVKNEAPERDYRYVQALLDKIAELEQSSDELSMEEIQKLRTEVDNAIEAIQEQ
ncbi:hypothetical protein E4N71_09900 [Treponema vincentii]|uniref:hypothetical protein n=1 Tax=Treponema vincentii TaxID=69710 RepID=UPI0020A4B85D|nr:hypothetical protein [Treponema vincentii]UTC46055.1 hypothetical protein E4N72_05525 [Treponema vincentii]